MRKLNPEECEHLHIGKSNDNIVNYTTGELVVQQMEEEKDIDVVVDSSLEFHKKLKRQTMLVIIRRTFQNLSKGIFLPLYNSSVRSHLDFASSVCCPHELQQIGNIEKVQRKATQV